MAANNVVANGKAGQSTSNLPIFFKKGNAIKVLHLKAVLFERSESTHTPKLGVLTLSLSDKF